MRDIEELMLARGIVVSHETIRTWWAKFGPEYARGLRRRAPEPGDTWFLDEVFVKIGGIRHYLWRAVDQDGMSSTSWSNHDATRRRRNASSAS